jgi:hypothetical protein
MQICEHRVDALSFSDQTFLPRLPGSALFLVSLNRPSISATIDARGIRLEDYWSEPPDTRDRSFDHFSRRRHA